MILPESYAYGLGALHLGVEPLPGTWWVGPIWWEVDDL